MRIKIACVGSLKEKYLILAEKEYKKRISKYAKIEILEVDEVLPKGSGQHAKLKAIDAQSEKLLALAKDSDYIIALSISGKQMTSEEFSGHLKQCKLNGISSFCFIIGGSDGFNDKAAKKSDLILSFSQFTMPHQLFRIVLLEQIYRSMKIEHGETYHK